MFPSYYGTVELVLTDYCPFHCKYCFVADKTPKQAMSMSVVDKTLSLYNPPPQVVFMGGEPLIELNLIDQIITKYPNLNYQVVTSGLINLEEFVDNIRPKVPSFDFQVSWDGFITTRENPEKVWNGIEYTLRKGQGVQARCVISDANAHTFFTVYRIFAERHKQYPKFYADFTFAYVDSMNNSTPDHIEAGLLLILQDAKKNNYSFLPQTICKYLNKYFTKDYKTCFCGAGNYVSVKPNGDAYPCTSMASLHMPKLGNVAGNLDLSIISSLRNDLPPQCMECNIKYMCGGGCRYERMLCFKEEWGNEVVEHRCKVMRAIFNAIDIFYKSLSLVDKYHLAEIVASFRMWESSYAVHSSQSNNLKDDILRR